MHYSTLLSSGIFFSCLWTYSTALLLNLEIDSKAQKKIPDYAAKEEVFMATKSTFLTRLNELYSYSIIPPRFQPTDYISELGGAEHWKDVKEKVDRIHRDRVYVEDLNVDSSKTDITGHPGSIFIPTPPHHAQQHKYFARFDKNGIIALYDGFFAITNTKEQADYFLEAFFRGLSGAKECANPDPECAASYIKLLQRISKKPDSAFAKKDNAWKGVPAGSSTKEVAGTSDISGGSQGETNEQRPVSSLMRQPSNRRKGGGRGGHTARLRRRVHEPRRQSRRR